MITEEQIAEACNKAYFQVGHNAYFGNGFTAGVSFAEQHYQSEKAELVEMLDEARLQIEYLQDKFGETGSGNSVLSRMKQLLTKING